jgi:hypothetical protein
MQDRKHKHSGPVRWIRTAIYRTCDAAIAPVTNWAPRVDVDLSPYPNVLAHRKRVTGRPTVRLHCTPKARFLHLISDQLWTGTAVRVTSTPPAMFASTAEPLQIPDRIAASQRIGILCQQKTLHCVR